MPVPPSGVLLAATGDVVVEPAIIRNDEKRALLFRFEREGGLAPILHLPHGWIYDGDKKVYTVVTGEGGTPHAHESLPEQVTSSVGRHTLTLTRGILVPIAAAKLDAARLLDEAQTRPVMTVLDVAMRHAKHASPLYQVVGASIFRTDGRHDTLSHTCDMWHGFRQTVVLTEKGPMLQCDFGVSTFLKPMAVTAFLEAEVNRSNRTRGRPLHDPSLAASIEKAIKGRKVVSSHLRGTPREGQEYRIKSLAEPPGEAKFTDDHGREWTVLEFFAAMEPPVRLSRPELPTLAMNGGKVKIPMELCSFVPAQPKRDVTPDERVKIVGATSDKPHVRLGRIQEFCEASRRVADPTLDAFAIDIGPLESVQARVLPTMAITYKAPSGEHVDVRVNGKGSWHLGNPRGPGDLCFTRGASLTEPWAVVVFREGGHAEAFLPHQAFEGFVRRCVKIRIPTRAPCPLLAP